jgi:hypothetical protein
VVVVVAVSVVWYVLQLLSWLSSSVSQSVRGVISQLGGTAAGGVMKVTGAMTGTYPESHVPIHAAA